MKVSPTDTARIKSALAAVVRAAKEADEAKNTWDMQQRLNTVWAATRYAQQVLQDVDAITFKRALKELESA